MQMNHYNADAIFFRTPKGHIAMTQNPDLLNAPQRRVLMAIAERATPLGTLIGNVPRKELTGTVTFLVKEGFIVCEDDGDATDVLATNFQQAKGAKKRASRRTNRRSTIERLKNPEIFTAQCRGGFASGNLAD